MTPNQRKLRRTAGAPPAPSPANGNEPSAADGLNPAQSAAVEAPGGPVLVLAGPGSGKTRVLTERVAYLLAGGVPAYRVMAVTFTNKAAREMRERLARRLGEAAVSDLQVGTFHALCARMLRRLGPRVGVQPNFVIYDAADQRRVVRRAMEELDIDPKRHDPRAIHGAISRAKNDLVDPDGYVASYYFEEIVRRVFPRYQALLRASNALDFDDLLVEVARLLRDVPDVRDQVRSRYAHVLVDEFQDTNLAQYEILKGLVPVEEHDAERNLFVVGDEDQSIYSWRGADFRNVERFQKDFSDATVVLLEQNYRSSQNVLDAAGAVIDRNANRTPKRLWTDAGPGASLVLFEAYNEAEEAAFALQEVHRLQRAGHRLGDIAVTYRTNAQSRAMEDVLVRYRVPYTLVGATRFYERREVRDVLAYLRAVHNPRDEFSLGRVLNVPPRGIGPKARALLEAWSVAVGGGTWDALEALAHDEGPKEAPVPDTRTRNALLAFHGLMTELLDAKRHLPAPELVTLVLKRSSYVDWLRDGSDDGEERWENVRELRGVAEDFSSYAPGEGLAAMLESVALVSDTDDLESQPDRLTLLTLHSAKGLEFDAVLILGLEEGLLPHARSMDDDAGIEEERRLFYVGLTRAREHVVLVHTFRRTLFGSDDVREASRFLDDLPADLVEVRGSAAQGKARPRTRSATEWASGQAAVPGAGGFSAGDKVRHGTFGPGVVVSAAAIDGDEEVTVAFEGAGVKKLLQSFARLERR